MKITSLASGSSANAYLIQSSSAAILVDAGLTATSLARELHGSGVDPAQISAIFLTHEHSDHVAGAGIFARRFGCRVFGPASTLQPKTFGGCQIAPLAEGDTIAVDGLTLRPFELPHDAKQTFGYAVDHDGSRAIFATDCGHIPPSLLPDLAAADLLVIDSNHDLEMLRIGPYPARLKGRIASQTGHLSNEQAARTILASCSGRQRTVWLAHLSAKNNTQRLARTTATEVLRQAGVVSVKIEVAGRDRRSVSWDSTTPTQARLF